MSKKAVRMGYTARSRLSPVEKKMLFSLTKKEGTSVSEWIRLQIHLQHRQQLEVDLGLERGASDRQKDLLSMAKLSESIEVHHTQKKRAAKK